MKILVPFRKTPELTVQYIRLFRDVEIQYKILQFITPMYEQAKVEERRQTPSVLVLDRAFPAERKARPRTVLYTLLAFVIALMLGVAGILPREAFERMKAGRPGETEAILSALRSDWGGLRLFGRRR
jgi:uncharacterized protein involved in exopolysaccharide biosynthesis